LWLEESVRTLSVEGLQPGYETVVDGSYPISRPIYLASVDEPNGEAREFAQWLLAGAEGVLERR
jgi:phosphate transport system substrate-binding protein